MSERDQRLQLLGLAFAGADLVFEVGQSGRIGLCLGAAEQVTGSCADQLQRRSWLDIFSPADRQVVESALPRLAAGGRVGPLCVQLASSARAGRYVNLSMLRLPQQPDWTSCALSPASSTSMLTLPRSPDGLIEAAAFEDATDALLSEAAQSGHSVSLDFVEMPGLAAEVRRLGGPAGDQARQSVSATLRAQAFQGMAAAEVAPDRFALIRTGEIDAPALLDQLQAVTDRVKARHQSVTIGDGSGEDVRAIRHTLNRFIEKGASLPLSALLAQTLDEAARFRRRLADGDFALHYQPIVRLKDNDLHHFEALVRFDPGVSPAEVISMAEELDLITEFDMAVARHGVQLLTTCEASIAVNISAASLCRPAFQSELLALTARDRKLARRLLLELTETQALSDLEAAAKALQVLRDAGHQICLDDFGAGAASIDYVRHLPLDFIKVDGRYVRSSTNGRDRLILRHLVALCHDLRIPVIAECVETIEVAEVLRALEVEYAQGWHFGRPQPRPVWQAPALAPSRRRGAVETWA